jgi:hypothetical protein
MVNPLRMARFERNKERVRTLLPNEPRAQEVLRPRPHSEIISKSCRGGVQPSHDQVYSFWNRPPRRSGKTPSAFRHRGTNVIIDNRTSGKFAQNRKNVPRRPHHPLTRRKSDCLPGCEGPRVILNTANNLAGIAPGRDPRFSLDDLSSRLSGLSQPAGNRLLRRLVGRLANPFRYSTVCHGSAGAVRRFRKTLLLWSSGTPEGERTSCSGHQALFRHLPHGNVRQLGKSKPKYRAALP